MKRTNRTFLLLLFLILLMQPAVAQVPRGSDVERRVNELLARMTLAESLDSFKYSTGKATAISAPNTAILFAKGYLAQH